MSATVSVVILYHSEPEEFLRECLASVLAQTLPSWEAIVVDDASTTRLPQRVVTGLADPRLKAVRHEVNRGLGASRNTGTKAAGSPLIAMLDADDRFHPEFLEATVGALHAHPDADWAVTDWQVFGLREEVWPFPIDKSLNCPAHFLFVGAGAVMRRGTWERIGGYAEDPRLRGGEDWDFWITAAERGLRPHHVARPLYLYRLHRQAMSRTVSPSNEYQARQMLYRRHRTAFHTMGLECPKCRSPRVRVQSFLAQGALVSSFAALERGEHFRALGLATGGLARRPGDRALWKQFARSVLPGAIRRLLGRR